MNYVDELEESDVVFYSEHSWSKGLNLPRNDKNKKKKTMMMMMSSSPRSLPVNIPAATGVHRYGDIDVAGRESFDQSSDDDYDDDDERMGRLPPHMIVERRVSGEIARSFSPLKGRNLCQVRNSILKMTGFLET